MSGKRLLAIDDEPDFMEIVRTVAEELGYEVKITDKADQFAEVYETLDPDVIVLDLVMPEVDGVELAQWLALPSLRVPSPFNADLSKRHHNVRRRRSRRRRLLQTTSAGRI